MGLKPLEFSDCISDSPWFRQNLHEHEAALEEAYKNIKIIEVQCRELINCNKKLSVAHCALAKSLSHFRLESVGTNETDDERLISTCLGEFGKVIETVEDEREKILGLAEDAYLEPLRKFRQEVIGRTLHEEKKKYEKESAKFYSSLDKHLHLSTIRKSGDEFREADAQLQMQQQNFCQASLQYVEEVQTVQERMKIELVETLTKFMYAWLTFYHVGSVVHEDFKPFLDSMQLRLQKTSESYNATQAEAEELKKKILKSHTKIACGAPTENGEECPVSENSTRNTIKQGYMYLQEKSKIPKTLTRDVLKGTWSKYYCVFSKETRIFTLIAVNVPTKTDMRSAVGQSVSYRIRNCIIRSSDSIDKRFCVDVKVDEKEEKTLTLQALSEDDRKQWMDAMQGSQPAHSAAAGPPTAFQTELDETGFDFVRHCIQFIEDRGLDEQGLYRNCGVNSKVKKMMALGLEKRKGVEKLNWTEEGEWEMKTVSSALKTYLRNLPEPLMTFDLHNRFITAAKMDERSQRIQHIHYYVYQLPPEHKEMLQIVMAHLRRVADRSAHNLMTVGNLGVCFGPTLLRPREETVAAIMDIKFCNVVVEVLISNCLQIFSSPPPSSLGPPKPEAHHQPSIHSIPTAVESEKDEERPPPSPLSLSSHSNVASVLPMRRETRPPITRNISAEGEGVHAIEGDRRDQRHIKRSAHVDGQRARSRFLAGSSSSRESVEETVETGESANGRSVLSCPPSSSTAVHYCGVRFRGMGREGGGGRVPRAPSPIYAFVNPVSVSPCVRVRTLYTCTPDHESELSFEAGQIITNVIESQEEGWLIGTLNGKTGLIPANYVEQL